MSDNMGTFRTAIRLESHLRRGVFADLPSVLVDTGSEATWAPREQLEALGITPVKRVRFRVADGRAVERDAGYAIVHVGDVQTSDDVIFAEAGDMILLGARTLEGLNLRVDPVRHVLVDAGPVDAARAA